MNKPIYMSLQEVKKTSGKFDATHKVALYPDSKDEPPKWFSDFVNNDFKKLVDRIDKLENLVVSQFKQHKWIK